MTFEDKVAKLVAGKDQEGQRLDVFLGLRTQGLSRSRIQQLIKQGFVQVNQVPSKPGYRIREGDVIFLQVPPPQNPQNLIPEEVPFSVTYEDASLLVVNKPPGVVVHPAPGHFTGTLVHGLLRYCKDLSGIGGELRPGIVHRLDKDTSGLMVVAKTERAFRGLARQFKAGAVNKEYHALVHGVPPAICGTVDAPIGRHRYRRKQMSVDQARGRHALTEWRKIRVFLDQFALLSVRIKTGRTHQIRVHLAYLGYPVVGDEVYGHGKSWWKERPLPPKGIVLEPPVRQMLHSHSLEFTHPISGKAMKFQAGYAEDMKKFLESLGASERA